MSNAIALSGEQIAALERGEPLIFSTSHPTQDVVVLLASQYHRLKQLAISDEPASDAEVYSLLRDESPNDWADLSEFPTARPL